MLWDIALSYDGQENFLEHPAYLGWGPSAHPGRQEIVLEAPFLPWVHVNLNCLWEEEECSRNLKKNYDYDTFITWPSHPSFRTNQQVSYSEFPDVYRDNGHEGYEGRGQGQRERGDEGDEVGGGWAAASLLLHQLVVSVVREAIA